MGGESGDDNGNNGPRTPDSRGALSRIRQKLNENKAVDAFIRHNIRDRPPTPIMIRGAGGSLAGINLGFIRFFRDVEGEDMNQVVGELSGWLKDTYAAAAPTVRALQDESVYLLFLGAEESFDQVFVKGGRLPTDPAQSEIEGASAHRIAPIRRGQIGADDNAARRASLYRMHNESLISEHTANIEMDAQALTAYANVVTFLRMTPKHCASRQKS